MIDAVFAWVAAHPVTSAVALCYVLTFFTVRQLKPYLAFLSDTIWLDFFPGDLKRRGLLRALVFVSGVTVSGLVTAGLIVFDCCNLSGLQALWVMLSVGVLAPVVYDVVMFVLDMLEWLKILPAPVRDRIDVFFDRPEPATQEGENDV